MKLYSSRWDRLRRRFLRDNPLCVYCERAGKTKAATVVDHIQPHRGDMALFWRQGNWQPLCQSCHDRVKQRQERGGLDSACGVDGMPLDPRHPWNVERIH